MTGFWTGGSTEGHGDRFDRMRLAQLSEVE